MSNSMKSKVRNSYLISTVSISLVLFLMGAVGYMLLTTMDVAHSLKSGIVATVELKRGLSDVQTENIRRDIAAYPMASDVRFSSKEEKIQDDEFRELFGLEFEKILDENPLMDSFEVSLSAESDDTEQFEQFALSVEKIPGVERVSYPALLIEQVYSTVRSFQLIILFFGGALLAISLVLLNNTIRMAIFSRRGIINTMKLVGATRWFIMRPLLWKGIVSGFWAGIIASAMFAAAIYFIRETLPGTIYEAEMMRAAYVSGVMIAGGMLISLIFTWFATNRFINMKSNKIHLY